MKRLLTSSIREAGTPVIRAADRTAECFEDVCVMSSEERAVLHADLDAIDDAQGRALVTGSLHVIGFRVE